jgi:hypothetical protein
VEISQPLWLSTVALLVAIPIALWIARRMGDVLHQHDAQVAQVEFARVSCAIPAFEPTDPLGQIESLTQQEVALIQEILNERLATGHASPERIQELRQIHRRGLALRQCCGDPALQVEVSWLQRFGSLALMADLTELDRTRFEAELAERAEEVQHTIELRRMQSMGRSGAIQLAQRHG